MSKSAVFPYGITLQDGGTVDTFPAVEMRFQSVAGEWTTLFLLVDSGAALSALPRSDAAFFGIDVVKGVQIHVRGVSGQPLPGWRHIMRVRLGNSTFSLPVVFLDNDETPRVLGRAGVFEKFTIVF